MPHATAVLNLVHVQLVVLGSQIGSENVDGTKFSIYKSLSLWICVHISVQRKQ